MRQPFVSPCTAKKLYNDWSFESDNPHFSLKTTPNSNMTSRKIVQSILSREQAEGVGARVRRSIGTRALRNLDPFLMLDEFYVKKVCTFYLNRDKVVMP
jgi:hypothetical protein